MLSPERTLKLSPDRPSYLAVSVRVPANALAGTQDELTVYVGPANARAYTEVLFQPGLVARWPRRVSFSPPLSYFNLDLQNSGNGSDTYLVRLTSVGGDPAFYTRVELAPGAAKTIKIPVTSYDTFEISVRSQRSGLEKKGFISVTAPRRVEDGRFRLLGRLGLGYGYPSSFSTATSLAGPLSDYAYLRFGMGYTPGGVPAGNATLSFEGGYFSVAYGPSYGVALGLGENDLSVALSLSGPEPRGSLNLDLSRENADYGFSASLGRDPSFRLQASLGLRARASHLARGLQSDTLDAEVSYLPLESRVYGSLGYSFDYRKWPIRLRLSGDWKANEAARYGGSANAELEKVSLGGQISWTGTDVLDWSVAASSNNEKLGVESPLPFYVAATAGASRVRLLAGATLDLPDPWSDLGGEVQAEYSGDRWSFTVSGSSRASSWGGFTLWDVGGQLGWPLDENQIALSVRTGGSYLRGHAGLEWAPWKPFFSTRLGLEVPVGGAMLRTDLSREWYGGETRFSLSADLPWVVTVPTAVTEFFGGRRVGTVVGVVKLAGPKRLLEGLPIRAGRYTTTTDDQGRFTLELPPGEYVVEIDTGRLPAVLVALRKEARVTVEAKRTTTVELAVAARAVLQGKIRVEGEPPATPTRFAVEIADERGRKTSLFTDVDGSFTLTGLAPGVYRVRILKDLLPPGWTVKNGKATVELAAGETASIELSVRAPERKVFRGGLQILAVEPEVKTAPPGSAPLVRVKLSGDAEKVWIEQGGQVLGLLLPEGEDRVWSGRLRIPSDYEGPLQVEVYAVSGTSEARFPLFIQVSRSAPWGIIRARPVVKPGQQLWVAVHWYAPVDECSLEVHEQKIPMQGAGADWHGEFVVPEDAGNLLRFQVVAKLKSGAEVKVAASVLVR
ncbi:MSCRAMM family protein [Oceanithermus sp.]